MVDAVLREMLGPFAFILDFILANPELVSGILAVWLAVYIAGRIQLWKIEQQLKLLILEEGQRTAAAGKKSISYHGVYKRVEKQFQEGLPFGMFFIPHRLDLWPVPPTYAHVTKRIPLSQELIEKVLKAGGIEEPE
jgi:hypothetical protein